MVHVDLVAVLLGVELAGLPLPGSDAVARLGRVRLGIGNLNDLVRVEVGLLFARPRVLARKGAVLCQPYADCFAAGHIVAFADRSQAFALCHSLEDRRLVRRYLFRRIRHGVSTYRRRGPYAWTCGT